MTEIQLDASDFQPLLEFDMDARAIDEHWTYCDYLATFVARMVSHNRADPFLYSNLLSASLNELFETVYRTRKEAGQLRFCFLRGEQGDRVQLSLPCAKEEQDFLHSTLAEIHAPGASETYLEFLFSDGSLDRRIGLFELVQTYKAKIEMSVPGAQLVVLTVDLTLDEAASSD